VRLRFVNGPFRGVRFALVIRRRSSTLCYDHKTFSGIMDIGLEYRYSTLRAQALVPMMACTDRDVHRIEEKGNIPPPCADLCEGMGGVRRNWMLAGLDGGYLLKQTMARSLIRKALARSRSCCMCGKLSRYRPRHHEDYSHSKLLKLRSYVMAWGESAGIGCSQVWLVGIC
jgi:hypothetical protein